MKVILAQTAGFCKGVRRAMNMVLKETEHHGGKIFTDGPLIHNPQTIRMLEDKGVQVMGNATEPGKESTLFIRTHGITPQRRRELGELGVNLCDATCPDVAKIQGQIRRAVHKGLPVIIVGDPGHAEVEGLAGYAGEMGHIVSNVEQCKEMPSQKEACVVAQSTLDPNTYDMVCTELATKIENLTVLDTICRSTQRRQSELEKVAEQADAVVVVGGKNSANTKRLAEISSRKGTPTYHIETADEIDHNEMKQYRTVGVTAGASTPNWIITSVVEILRDIDYEADIWFFRHLSKVSRFMLDSNLYLAMGAAMLTVTNSELIGYPISLSVLATSFLYILSVHLMTRLTGQKKPGSHNFGATPAKRKLFVSIMVISGISALSLSALSGVNEFLLILSVSLLGIVYRLDKKYLLVPIGGKKIPFQRLPASKDIFMTLGWCVATLFFPLLAANHPLIDPGVVVGVLFTFLLVITRSLFYDIRDLQADQLIGQETIPTIIGTTGSKKLVIGLTFMLIVVLIAGSYLGLVTKLGYYLTFVAGYIFLYVYLYYKKVVYFGRMLETIGDLQFILCGIITLTYSLLLS